LKRILVTGATGLIGGRLVETLAADGHYVKLLVRRSSVISDLRKLGVELEYGDIRNSESVERAVKDVDVVYHLAAIRGERLLPREMYWDVNVKGTKNILEVSYKAGIEKFVYCSTEGVLGWFDNPPADESWPYKPVGMYHVTKTEAERLVKRYLYEKQLPATIIRPVIAYGPTDRGTVFKIASLIKKGRFVVLGHGDFRLHLVYIDNLIQGLRLAGEKKCSVGQIYIIADENPITFNRLIQIITETLNVQTTKIHIPIWSAKLAGLMVENLYRALLRLSIKKLGDDPILTPMKVDILSKERFYNISKAKKELGYTPTIHTEEGIAATINWYKKNNYF
jgi:nucleoside-diphosphate-sugar epimerase